MTKSERSKQIKQEIIDIKCFFKQATTVDYDFNTATNVFYSHYEEWRLYKKMPKTVVSVDIFGRIASKHGYKAKPIRFGKKVLRGFENRMIRLFN